MTDHRDDFEVLLERAYLCQPRGGKHEKRQERRRKPSELAAKNSASA